LGFVPGNACCCAPRIRRWLIACYLAIIKAGGVTVATMPLLRAKELSYAVAKGRIKLALCDTRLFDEMEKTRPLARELERIVYWGDGQLEDLMARPGYGNFTACDTASDDVCLIAVHLGHDRRAEGTMHFQRDMLASCRQLFEIRAAAEPRRPLHRLASLAFTFGSAGTCCFRSASARPRSSLNRRRPDVLLPAIAKYKATICFTAPTAYRAMLPKLGEHDIFLAAQVRVGRRGAAEGNVRRVAQGDRLKILDGIGATEMMHIFIGSPENEVRPGATGKLCRATRRRSSTTKAARARRHRRAPCGARARPAAAISATRGRRNTCRTAGTSRATRTCRMPTATSGTRRAPTT
jgi:2-aminobenzoate-CoA ligase